MILSHRWFGFLIFVFLILKFKTEAQIDPEKRRLVQLGYNQPIQGTAPIAGYAYYYLNEPGFIRTNLTLRLAIAPVYLDSELGVRNVVGAHTDLGLGLSGGGFADSFSELRRGKFWREESFSGHGAEVNLSLYHLFNPHSQIPLNGILRGGIHHSFYYRDDATAPTFILPGDQTIFHARSGLRFGGKEPLILPALAMEASVWYDGQFRTEPGSYGYGGDRRIEAHSHLFWTRLMLAYTLPEWRHNFNLGLTAGTSIDADRLSGYRLGGMLPMVAEFPLSLPGYNFQELSACRFVLVNGQYNLPLNHAKTFSLTTFAGSAMITFLPGMGQPGHWNSGVGGGLGYESPSRSWQMTLSYGYGIDAIRSNGRGAHTLNLVFQYDLEARYRSQSEAVRSRMNPNKFRGLNWLLGR